MRYVICGVEFSLQLLNKDLANAFEEREGLDMIILVEVVINIQLEMGFERSALHQKAQVVLPERLKYFVGSDFPSGVFNDLVGHLEFLFDCSEEVLIDVEFGVLLSELSFVKIQAVFY